jgi:hypothetical protein
MKRAAIFLVLVLAAPAAAQTPAASPPTSPSRIDVPYSQFTLSNGLRVVVREDHSVPMVTVNMWAPRRRASAPAAGSHICSST